MEFLGIDINVKNIPELDPGFIPLYKFNTALHGDAGAGGGRPLLRRAAGEEHALALRRLEGVHLRRPRRL